MGAQIRVYRQKIASTSSMKKIFKAMEMIATSRISKSRQSLEGAYPYANAPVSYTHLTLPTILRV